MQGNIAATRANAFEIPAMKLYRRANLHAVYRPGDRPLMRRTRPVVTRRASGSTKSATTIATGQPMQKALS
jgi:hypothetical protein